MVKILFCINDCFCLVTIVFKQVRKLFDEGNHFTFNVPAIGESNYRKPGSRIIRYLRQVAFNCFYHKAHHGQQQGLQKTVV